MPDGSGDLLTLQEAAEQLKVHYMTAYRWVRQGDLPAFKAGGRLRLRPSDVERFLTQRRVDVVLPQHGRTEWPTHVDRLYDLLTDGRAVEAAQLVRKVIADGAPAGQVYLDLLTPTLHRIGDGWEAGILSVAAEHRASEICNVIVARLSDSFRRRGPARGTAVTFTPPGEQHAIASAMAADFMRAGGFDVHHLGVNVPLADLRQFLQIVPCNVMCASFTNTGAEAAVYAEITRLGHDGGDTVVVFGGQGVDPDAAASSGGAVVESLADLVTCVEDLVQVRA
ncbi:MAG: helix-turn-helix domain-containing protein [Nitriliruptorales bacterium]|nr:helix-turn-helix domain-containing protein [Nitriliruptorales bacterium]